MFDVLRRHNNVFTTLSRGFATASSVAFCHARKRITYFTFMFSGLTLFCVPPHNAAKPYAERSLEGDLLPACDATASA
jgi:hypothetical protein